MLKPTPCAQRNTRARGGRSGGTPSGLATRNSSLSCPAESAVPLRGASETQGPAPPGFHFCWTPSQQTLRLSRCNNTAQGEALPQC